MMMSVIKIPAYRMYWSQYTKFPTISNIMSRDQFTNLHTHIYFNDYTNCLPSTHINQDKLFKKRPFIDAVQNSFESITLL